MPITMEGALEAGHEALNQIKEAVTSQQLTSVNYGSKCIVVATGVNFNPRHFRAYSD